MTDNRELDRPRSQGRLATIFGVACVAFFVYVAVASVAYALRHPDETDTERLLRIVDVLLWK